MTASRELHLAAEQAANDARAEAARDRATDPRRWRWSDEHYAGPRGVASIAPERGDE